MVLGVEGDTPLGEGTLEGIKELLVRERAERSRLEGELLQARGLTEALFHCIDGLGGVGEETQEQLATLREAFKESCSRSSLLGGSRTIPPDMRDRDTRNPLSANDASLPAQKSIEEFAEGAKTERTENRAGSGDEDTHGASPQTTQSDSSLKDRGDDSPSASSQNRTPTGAAAHTDHANVVDDVVPLDSDNGDMEVAPLFEHFVVVGVDESVALSEVLTLALTLTLTLALALTLALTLT